MRVLLVDDSDAVRRRLASLISEIRGVEIVGATGDGDEVIALVERASPDVVVLDLSLPGTHGLDLLPRIVAGASPPEVIVLTNHATRAHEQTSLERGATWFFDKSSEFHRVLEVLAAWAVAP